MKVKPSREMGSGNKEKSFHAISAKMMATRVCYQTLHNQPKDAFASKEAAEKETQTQINFLRQ